MFYYILKQKHKFSKKTLVFLLFVVISIFLESCIAVELCRPSTWKVLKMSFKEETIYNNQCMNFIIKDDEMYLPVVVNGKADTVFYDMGWSGNYDCVFLSDNPRSDGTYRKSAKIPQGKYWYSVDPRRERSYLFRYGN